MFIIGISVAFWIMWQVPLLYRMEEKKASFKDCPYVYSCTVWHLVVFVVWWCTRMYCIYLFIISLWRKVQIVVVWSLHLSWLILLLAIPLYVLVQFFYITELFQLNKFVRFSSLSVKSDCSHTICSAFPLFCSVPTSLK